MPNYIIFVVFLQEQTNLNKLIVAAEEALVRGIVRDVAKGVANLLQGLVKGLALALRHLETSENLAVVRTVVAVVEHGDVPAVGEFGEKVPERTRLLGELERHDDLVVKAADASADHVAHVFLGDGVV